MTDARPTALKLPLAVVDVRSMRLAVAVVILVVVVALIVAAIVEGNHIDNAYQQRIQCAQPRPGPAPCPRNW